MSALELAAGHLVGSYRVQGLLGRTGWATTYAAYVGEEEVALKVVDASVAAKKEVIAELEKAREVARDLPEDVVLAPLDQGIDRPSGVHFLVAPLSSHPSLADLVEICPLSAAEIIDLVASLAVALAPLHDRGIGHLALKPTNIFVGPPPAHAVRLGDLGADALRRGAGKAHPWLAPEQAEEGATPGPRADVFTAGLLVFFALTGRMYWKASGENEGELLAEIRGPRTPPSLRAQDLGVEIDPSVDEVLGRALSPDPQKRFPHARAFADALSVGLDDLTPAVPPVSVPPATSSVKPKATPVISTATPVAAFSPLLPMTLPTPVPEDRSPAMPPPLPPGAEMGSQRHIKATAKLLRFELPNAKPRPEPAPATRPGTVRVGKFDLDAALAENNDEAEEIDADSARSTSPPPPGRATVRMPPAAIPPGNARPTVRPNPRTTAAMPRAKLPGGRPDARSNAPTVRPRSIRPKSRPPSDHARTVRPAAEPWIPPAPEDARMHAPDPQAPMAMPPVPPMPNVPHAMHNTSHGHQRFALPPEAHMMMPQRAPRPKGASVGTILIIIGVGCIALFMALIVIVLVTRR